jgi:hypothetical protein
MSGGHMASKVDFQDFNAPSLVQSVEKRKREFQEIYKDWISAYNTDIEKNSLWCDAQEAWKESNL